MPPGTFTDFVNRRRQTPEFPRQEIPLKQEEPFFTSIRRGEVPSFSPRVFNVEGTTASGFAAPELPSLQQFLALTPFQQQMLLGAYGEEVRGPSFLEGPDRTFAQGDIRRSGIDAETVLAAIRRFSPVGRTGTTAFG